MFCATLLVECSSKFYLLRAASFCFFLRVDIFCGENKQLYFKIESLTFLSNSLENRTVNFSEIKLLAKHQ